MEEETAAEWRDLGNVLDRLLFYFSLIPILCVSLWMAAKSAQTPGEHGVPAVYNSTDY